MLWHEIIRTVFASTGQWRANCGPLNFAVLPAENFTNEKLSRNSPGTDNFVSKKQSFVLIFFHIEIKTIARKMPRVLLYFCC
jgi:hypothetical protein